MRLMRQGDVLLIPTDARPSAQATQTTDHGRVVVAYGEVTGHCHEVVGVDNEDPIPAMELFLEPDGSRLLVIHRPSELRHEEHARIALAPGRFEVRRQREYAPDMIRQVAD